ncbi:two-component system, NarL family, captular synthesis response regulator RcsB [Dyella sp. OK004]|nr:two-component system, NarL family, captular synthesis response regulator RcsB [Dyella sp. OK004]
MENKNNLCDYDYIRVPQGTGRSPAEPVTWDETYAPYGVSVSHKGLHIAEVGLQIRVIVADDHPVVLAGVQAVLERSPDTDIKVVGEARNGEELIELLKRCPCDVIITDFTMPGGRYGDGLQLISKLSSLYPNVPVILQTMVNNVGLLRDAVKGGALGLADKRSPMTELVQAVRTVAAKKAFISASLRERFEESELVKPTESGVELSPKELEVFRLYVGGLTVTKIAEKLNRSVKTVSTQKRQAMQKLGLEHDREMVIYAREHGFLE